MKSSTGREWRELAIYWHEIAEHRGSALSRIWTIIQTTVQDPVLAAELELAIIGDLMPNLEVATSSEEDADPEEEGEGRSE